VYEPDKHAIFDIFDAFDVRCVWGHLQCAETVYGGYPPSVREALDALYEMPGISRQDLVIRLEPSEIILAHTQEFIGTRRKYTTQMHARSSTGRAMIGVCKCAGKGDVGFFNRWTMEITSFSRYHTIPLKVGMRLAQIEFLPVGDTLKCYGAGHGKYQDSSDLQIVMSSWKPEMMLPHFHADWELKDGK
jgi:deoxycytidine triphosphate deaminase